MASYNDFYGYTDNTIIVNGVKMTMKEYNAFRKEKAKNKNKVLKSLLEYKGCIIVVDDIYNIDAQNNILAEFKRYESKQLKYSKRRSDYHHYINNAMKSKAESTNNSH